MLSDEDLKTALERAIITKDQFNELIALGSNEKDSDTDSHYSGSEEKFRFFKGFNEIFLSVGLLIFIGGLIGAIFAKSSGLGLLAMGIAPVVIWLLAEYFVRMKAHVLPAIVLTAAFATFSSYLSILVFKVAFGVFPSSARTLLDKQDAFTNEHALMALSIGACIGALIFYVRFKVPFALFVAAGAFILSVSFFLVLIGVLKSFDESAITMLALGLGVFALAMAYDLSDPMRKTRAAVCAFWLHLVAAPVIVHAAMTAIGITLKTSEFDIVSAGMIVAVMLVLSLVALAIDRRALLVSAFTYLGWAIAYLLGTFGAKTGLAFPLTLLLLGAIVLILGTGWQSLRNRLLGPVRNQSPFKYLPPLTLPPLTLPPLTPKAS